MRVDVYFNLRKRVFSIRHRRKVIEHAACVVIRDPAFVVSEKGRQRVLKEKRKNIHACVRGELVYSGEMCRWLPRLPNKAHYNPYAAPNFPDCATRSPVNRAGYALLFINQGKPSIEYAQNKHNRKNDESNY